jgi:hypothetical protein
VRQDVTVGDALGQLRCRGCDEPPEIALLFPERMHLAPKIRAEADVWRPIT